MEAQNNTTIREAYNNVNIVGWLKEMKLEQKEIDGNSVITGTLTITTAPNCDHRVSVWASKLTKNNTPSKSYPGYLTVMNEYVSIASLMAREKNPLSLEAAMEECSKVEIGGKLRRNEYFGDDGQFQSYPSISANFCSRVKDEFKPKAIFDIECYINTIRDEMKNGDLTGRKIIDTYVPIFNGGIIPFEFVIPANLANDFDNAYSVGSSAKFTGDLVNTVIIETAPQGGFGRPIENRTYVNEYLIVGGNPPYVEESENYYSKEAISAALRVRETETLPEMERKSKEKKKSNSSAPRANGFSAPVDAELAQAAKNFVM